MKISRSMSCPAQKKVVPSKVTFNHRNITQKQHGEGDAFHTVDTKMTTTIHFPNTHHHCVTDSCIFHLHNKASLS